VAGELGIGLEEHVAAHGASVGANALEVPVLAREGPLGALLEVQVVFRPDERSETLPAWFMDRYADALIAGAIIWLATQPGTQRLNADIVAIKTKEWHEALNDATAEFLMNRDQKSGGIRIGA
jgi:hypothetical protein